MYGFGDVENPRPDTVELLEDLVIDYITDIVQSNFVLATKFTKMIV